MSTEPKALLCALGRDASEAAAARAVADAAVAHPTVYDIAIDDERPVSQSDVDNMQDMSKKFGQLMQLFRMYEAEFAAKREASK